MVSLLFISACGTTGETAEPSLEAPDRIYLIQVQTTDDKAAAEAAADEAADWWAQAVPDTGDPDIDVVFQAPYYRVRLGPFDSRDDAQTALESLRERFPDAFLVPIQPSF